MGLQSQESEWWFIQRGAVNRAIRGAIHSLIRSCAPMAISFGRYALLRKLAEGGMAELFIARQSGLEGFEKLCVVKRILPQLSKDESFVKMFLNEARVAARLNHGNIVQIWDLGKTEDRYFIAMEYVHGEDLREVMRVAEEKRLRPSPGLACRVVADTLAGLHYAHTRASADGKPLGLVHRDVSPQNVLVTYEGGVKLVDFGIAKATRASAEQTQAGLFKGKFSYMSPEQSKGRPLDARSDVFAVGILLWELLTWQRLFKRANEMATLIAVAEEPIPSPRQVVPEIPPRLERIVMRALERPLGERYQSAQEMRADLESLLREQRWEADALALERFMRELFAEKLRAQDEDVRAAGMASLEDFLMRVEAGTQISWMPSKSSSVRTPSSGLPSASLPPKAKEDLHGFVSAPTLVASPHLTPSKPTRLPAERPAPVPERAPAAPPAVEPPPVARTDGPSGMIIRAGADVSTLPSMAPIDPSHFGATPESPLAESAADRSTAKRASFDPPPRGRRVLVIAIAAAVVAGLGLTVALWPASQAAQPPPITVENPAEPTRPVAPPVRPAQPGAAPTTPEAATLSITTDADATITVDGKPQPPGRAATVSVEPGVPHVVSAQRPGHSVHKVNVKPLEPGATLPVAVKLR